MNAEYIAYQIDCQRENNNDVSKEKIVIGDKIVDGLLSSNLLSDKEAELLRIDRSNGNLWNIFNFKRSNILEQTIAVWKYYNKKDRK